MHPEAVVPMARRVEWGLGTVWAWWVVIFFLMAALLCSLAVGRHSDARRDVYNLDQHAKTMATAELRLPQAHSGLLSSL